MLHALVRAGPMKQRLDLQDCEAFGAVADRPGMRKRYLGRQLKQLAAEVAAALGDRLALSLPMRLSELGLTCARSFSLANCGTLGVAARSDEEPLLAAPTNSPGHGSVAEMTNVVHWRIPSAGSAAAASFFAALLFAISHVMPPLCVR